jgi:hypothetical protein
MRKALIFSDHKGLQKLTLLKKVGCGDIAYQFGTYKPKQFSPQFKDKKQKN